MIHLNRSLFSLRLTTSAAIATDSVVSVREVGVNRDNHISYLNEITTATTTTILGANTTNTPSLPTDIVSIRVTNNHASTTQTVRLSIYNGVSDRYITPTISIPAGHTLVIENGVQYIATPSGGTLASTTTTKKSLGQSAPSATTETDLYTCPAGKSAGITSFFITNRGAAAGTFRISVSVGGGATANKDYLHYDVNVNANDTLLIDAGGKAMAYLSATDKIRVYASTANFSFNAFGEEYQ